MEETVEAAMCTCTLDWQRVFKREVPGTCYGEQYIPYSTTRKHYKLLFNAMKKKGKHDKVVRPKPEKVDRHIVLFQNKRRNINAVDLRERSNEIMQYHFDDDTGCSFESGGDFGPLDEDVQDDPDFQINESQRVNEARSALDCNEEPLAENDSNDSINYADRNFPTEEETEEEEEEESMDLEKQLEAGAHAFARKRTEEEVYGDTSQHHEVTDLEKSLGEWRQQCSKLLFEGAQGTVGDDVRDLLELCLKRAMPIGAVWELFDYRSKYNPNYPMGKELRSVIRRMGMKFLLEVTCQKHHPPQPDSKRGSKCGYVETPDDDPCDLVLKIGIRYDSIKNYLGRKLLDPEFCSMIHESNDKYWKDSDDRTNSMTSIFHGKLYESIGKRFPDFLYSDDHVPIHLGIFADGFQPFDGVNHTLFAVILICFNLPPEVRMREENLHILTLIDGPKEPNAKFQQYLKPIVDELLEFWEEGWHLHHAIAGTKILFKGACVCCLQDGRASKACSMQAEAGHYHGCRICSLHGQQANGVHYFSHTALLPQGHPYRFQEGGYVQDKVIIKDDLFIRRRMQLLEEHPEMSSEAVFMGVQGKSEFSRLPYYDLSVGHVLCFMHCLANTVKRLEKLAFEMMDAQQILLIKGYLNGIKPLSTIRSTFDRFFQSVDSTNTGDEQPLTKKRAQQYKDFALTGVMASALMAAGIRQDLVDAAHNLFYNLDKLLSCSIHSSDLDEIETKIWESICDLEKCIEHKNMTLAIHSMGHFARQVKYLGPIRETWAYGTESKLGNLKRKTFNKFLPGACIMHRQCYEESLRFLARNSCNIGRVSSHERRSCINLRGSPKRKRLTTCGYPMDEAQLYIRQNWKEYQELVNSIGLDDFDSLWTKVEEMPEAIRLERYSGRERGILGIPPIEAYFYKALVINGRILETQNGAESKSRTSNCGIMCKTSGTQRALFARIQSIIVMQYDHGPELFLEVKKLKHLGEHKHLKGIQVVSPDPMGDDIFIQLHDIRDQVFFSRDMTTGDTGQLLVHRKGNAWTLDDYEE